MLQRLEHKHQRESFGSAACVFVSASATGRRGHSSAQAGAYEQHEVSPVYPLFAGWPGCWREDPPQQEVQN